MLTKYLGSVGRVLMIVAVLSGLLAFANPSSAHAQDMGTDPAGGGMSPSLGMNDPVSSLPEPDFQLQEPQLGDSMGLAGLQPGPLAGDVGLVPDLQLDPEFTGSPDLATQGMGVMDPMALPDANIQLNEPELGDSSPYGGGELTPGVGGWDSGLDTAGEPGSSSSGGAGTSIFNVQLYTPDLGSTEPPSLPGFPERGTSWPEDNPSGLGLQVDINLGPVDIQATVYGGGDSGFGATVTFPISGP